MGNGRGMPKPAASCTTTVMPGMVIKTQLTSRGGRQGAAGRHGAAADQPPARLPGLRQGRRVPAAEPGDEQRPGRVALPRRQADLPQADRDLLASPARPRALRAVPALHPVLRADRRRPVHRPARARRAAADRHLRRRAVPVLLLRQHRPDLPGRRADQRVATASAPGRSTCCRTDRRASTARRAARCAPTGGAARSPAGWPASDPEVNEEWNCDKGRWAFHYADPADRLLTPLVRDETGELVEASWPEALERAARGPARGRDARRRRRAARRPADRRGRLRLREVRPGRAGHQRHRLPGPPAQRRGAGLPRRVRRRRRPRRTSPTPTWRPRRPCCWSASSPRRSRRSSSCGCARRPAPAGTQVFVVAAARLRAAGQARRHAAADRARRRGGRARRRCDGAVVDARCAPRRADPRRRAAGHVARRADARRPRWPPRPAPGWPGCRAAPASAARSTPARCRPCCPVAGRSPTTPPGSRSSASGAPASRRRRAATPTTSSPRLRDGAARRPVVGGVDPADLADPAAARAALATAGFVVSLEMRHSAVTEHADVVLPVAAVAEKAGRFVDWEGRRRPFDLPSPAPAR